MQTNLPERRDPVVTPRRLLQACVSLLEDRLQDSRRRGVVLGRDVDHSRDRGTLRGPLQPITTLQRVRVLEEMVDATQDTHDRVGHFRPAQSWVTWTWRRDAFLRQPYAGQADSLTPHKEADALDLQLNARNLAVHAVVLPRHDDVED